MNRSRLCIINTTKLTLLNVLNSQKKKGVFWLLDSSLSYNGQPIHYWPARLAMSRVQLVMAAYHGESSEDNFQYALPEADDSETRPRADYPSSNGLGQKRSAFTHCLSMSCLEVTKYRLSLNACKGVIQSIYMYNRYT